MVNSPLIRPAISWGKCGIGGVPLGSHDETTSPVLFVMHFGQSKLILIAKCYVWGPQH